MRRAVLTIGLLSIVALLGSGCIVPSQEGTRKAGWSLQNSGDSQPEMKTGSGPLIKPSIPQESAATSPATRTPEDGSARPEHAGQMPAVETDNPFEEKPKPKDEPPKPFEPPKQFEPPQAPQAFQAFQASPTQKGPAKEEWEDQKVRDAAVEMAKASPEVKKIKICYAVKEHEWWVILYERGEGFFELKQFIWNKESERLEPYLVLKRIPAARLQQHLTEEDPGKACEVMELPSTAPGGQAVGPGDR